MTRRSIIAGEQETIIVKGAGSVKVKGHDANRVTAETYDKSGLTLERRSASQVGRARAALGDRVLFDIRLETPGFLRKAGDRQVIEVQLGGDGEVLVPLGSTVKVYAGNDIDVQGITGQVDAFAGRDLNLVDLHLLGNASAGGAMNIDCQTMIGNEVTYGAGNDLRFHVSELTSAYLRVRDIGGYWEARIGGGEKSVYLKSGGDVTLVTDQPVEPLPPDYMLGRIEKPSNE